MTKPDFKDLRGIRPVLDLIAEQWMYPYLHKSRAELAPALAATLKRMKAEGLIAQYQREAWREAETR
jgi:hypothetical protein